MRQHTIDPNTTNLAQRARLASGMGQEEFSAFFRVALSTLRNHEQDRTSPGAACTYYELIARFPDKMKKMVASLPTSATPATAARNTKAVDPLGRMAGKKLRRRGR